MNKLINILKYIGIVDKETLYFVIIWVGGGLLLALIITHYLGTGQ